MRRASALEQAAMVLPEDLASLVHSMGIERKSRTEELRLRRGFPMTAVLEDREEELGGRPVTENELRCVLENATRASAHTALDQVKNGFVTVRGGHRIGLCGTAACRDGKIITLRYLTSLSIRIACPVEGQAGQILPQLMEGGSMKSTLILAPPGAGKTTLLRELVRLLSDGIGCCPCRVGVADERGELAALWQGEPQFDLGRHTDVIDGCSKAEGLSILLRGMNPQVLAADEITDAADVRAITEASGCGAVLLATAHGNEVEDLSRRPVYRALLESGVFCRVVILSRQGAERRTRVEVLP